MLGSSGAPGNALLERFVSTGAAGTRTFTLPQSYSSVIIKVWGRTDAASAEENILIRFNADTGTNYDYQMALTFGTTASASEGVAVDSIIAGGVPGTTVAAGASGVAEISIPFYRNTTFDKDVLVNSYAKRGTATGTFRQRVVGGTWRNTAAITSVTVALTAGNFLAGSVIEVWMVP